MALLVDVSSVIEADLPSVAYIQPAAMHNDLIHQFIFTDRDDVLAEKLTLDQLRSSAKDPKSDTFKATTRDTKQIVGYANIRFEDYGEDRSEAVKPVLSESSPQENSFQLTPPPVGFPPGMNGDFCKMYFGEKKAVHTRLMSGKSHFHLTTLMVLPAYQRKGIGSELLRWMLTNTEINKWPVWVAAHPKGRELYRQFGWEDVENFDIDLSQWADPLSGYGVHRSVLMIRPPGGAFAQ